MNFLSELLNEGYKEVTAKWGSTEEVTEYINKFKLLVQQNRLTDLNERNIDWWGKNSTFDQFKLRVDEITNTKSKTQVRKETVKSPHEDAKFIGKHNGYEVYSIHSHDAAQFMGRMYCGISSKWCISTSNSEYFRSSNNYGNHDFYFLINPEKCKLKAVDCKIAVQVEDVDEVYGYRGEMTAWDLEDEPHTIDVRLNGDKLVYDPEDHSEIGSTAAEVLIAVGIFNDTAGYRNVAMVKRKLERKDAPQTATKNDVQLALIAYMERSANIAIRQLHLGMKVDDVNCDIYIDTDGDGNHVNLFRTETFEYSFKAESKIDLLDVSDIAARLDDGSELGLDVNVEGRNGITDPVECTVILDQMYIDFTGDIENIVLDMAGVPENLTINVNPDGPLKNIVIRHPSSKWHDNRYHIDHNTNGDTKIWYLLNTEYGSVRLSFEDQGMADDGEIGGMANIGEINVFTVMHNANGEMMNYTKQRHYGLSTAAPKDEMDRYGHAMKYVREYIPKFVKWIKTASEEMNSNATLNLYVAHNTSELHDWFDENESTDNQVFSDNNREKLTEMLFFTYVKKDGSLIINQSHEAFDEDNINGYKMFLDSLESALKDSDVTVELASNARRQKEIHAYRNHPAVRGQEFDFGESLIATLDGLID